MIDLRDMLLSSGASEMVLDHFLAVLLPAVSALKRQRGTVDSELMWVLIAVAADAYQRKQPPR
jgi:hypothetical protein